MRHPFCSWQLVQRFAGFAICYWLFPLSSHADPAIQISGFTKVSNNWNLTIETTLTNHLDVYHVSRLNGSPWSLATTGLSVNGSLTLNTQTNDRSGYFIIGNADIDSDTDGLADARETYVHQTDSSDSDTDNDTMPDGWEIGFGLAPRAADAAGDLDSDGLSNLQEFQFGASPNLVDTDGDTLTDGWEFTYFGSPTNADANADNDSDGWNNRIEHARGGRPFAAMRSDTNNLTQIQVNTPWQIQL